MRLIYCLALLLALPACTNPPQQTTLRNTPPADFAVSIRTVHRNAHQHPLLQDGAVVLESSRNLRMARIGLAEQVTFPPITTVLKPQQFQDVYDIVRLNQLMAEPTSPIVEAARQSGDTHHTVYRVEITAQHRRHRYQTTPEESPPTVALLAKLLEYGTSKTPPPLPPTLEDLP